jgi:hypothetical protein
MKQHKYTTTFGSIKIKPLVSSEKDEYLALASMEKLSDFIPEVNTEENVDLLPIAFNACVANRVNKNGDVVDGQTAVAMAKNFVNKQINIEHNRERVVGVILKAGFSQFGTDEPMDEVSASELKSPFNITLGGVIWKVVNNNLAKMIENSSDPTSEDYEKISASWELGFSDYNLVMLEGEEKNIEDGVIISDSQEIEKHKGMLRSLGGSGKTEDGRSIYRKVINDVVPLGIGLTENPAADVVGVLTHSKQKNTEKIEENNSHSETQNVNKTKEQVMKLNSIEELTDEKVQEMTASVVSDFIQDQLKQASEQYSEEKAKFETELAEAKENYDKLVNENEASKTELESVVAELAALKEQLASSEAEKAFSLRMSKFDESFDLTDEDREVIASDIAGLDEEAFEAYEKKISVLLSSKVKSDEKEVEAKVEEVVASVEPEAKEVVEDAVDSATPEADVIANSATVETPSFQEKYAKAFSMEGFKFTK